MPRTITYWASTGIVSVMLLMALVLPGLPLVKEWAYAGLILTWTMALMSTYANHEGPQIWVMPLVLLVLLGVSYATRPAGRRLVKA